MAFGVDGRQQQRFDASAAAGQSLFFAVGVERLIVEM